MKPLIALLALAAASLAFAQEPVPVRLDPAADSPVIGELEARSLAVPAEWPVGSQAQPGWKPVYLHGVFEVYVDNNDIGKDLMPKPGSLYYLAPDKSSTKLSIATKKDKVDIISVDVWFTKVQLETILVGYIRENGDSRPQAQTAASNAPANASASNAASLTEMVGFLQKAGMLGRNRHGVDYKLVSADGKTLAFLDASQLPELVRVSDLLAQKVRVTGALRQTETGNGLILEAESVKKAN